MVTGKPLRAAGVFLNSSLIIRAAPSVLQTNPAGDETRRAGLPLNQTGACYTVRPRPSLVSAFRCLAFHNADLDVSGPVPFIKQVLHFCISFERRRELPLIGELREQAACS